MSSLFFLYTILALTDIFCTRILFYSPTDTHRWTRILPCGCFFLNTNRTNFTNLFGTRMDADGHGFTVRRITLFILPQIDTDGHRFLPCGWWGLNTNFTNIFLHTDTHGWTRILPCGPLDIIRTLKRRTNWSSPL